MNPFDLPPVGPPLSSSGSPASPPPPPDRGDGPVGPRRGRLLAVALTTAAVLTGGVVVAAQYASADDPVVSTATAPPDNGDDADHDGGEPDEAARDSGASLFGGVDLPACLDDLLSDWSLPGLHEGSGDDVDGDDFGDFELDDFDLGEFDLGEFDLDGLLEDLPFGSDSVTVTGPDGTDIIEFGEGDGSVTVTREGGELQIETSGDVEVTDLEAWFDDLDLGDLDLGDLDLDELDLGELDLDGLEDFDGFDLEQDFAFDLGDVDLDAWTDCLGELGLDSFGLDGFDFEMAPPTEG